MVFRKISSDMKDCALRLWELGWSREDICSTLCVSQASLYRWAALFEEFGSATAPPPLIRGRPRIIGMVAMNTIREIYARNSTVYLDELQWHLAIFHDIAISTSALQETLERAGLTRKVLRKIATERDEVRRAEFLHNIQHGFSGTGDEFVVVDESSKNEHTLTRRYGRAPIGQDAILTAPFVRGDRYSLVAAMSKTGYLASRVVPGSLDSYEFFDFIVEEVVPVMKPFPDAHSVLVMDNCRIHHTDTLQDVLNHLQIMLLYLPPYSPDLNPIEESFSTWKAYLRRHGETLRGHDDPIFILQDTLGCITAEMALNWFQHAGYIVHDNVM